MEFIVSSSKLNQQLQIISKVIKAKPTLPILEYFLFSINGKQLKLTATDLETTIVCSLDLDNASEDINIAIESKRLLNILKEFAEQPLIFNIKKDDNNDGLSVTIKTNSGIYQLMADAADEFPKVPTIDKDSANKFTLKSKIFIKGIQTSIFATGNDEYRPVMNGIFCEIFENQINMVATDAHKLVKYNYKNLENNFSNTFILPQKTASLLKNINPPAEEDIQVIFNEKNIFIQIENFQLVAQLIEGKFPNYQVVIPESNNKKLTIDRLDFLNALRRVSVFANTSTNLVKLSINSEKVVIEGKDIDFSISGSETLNAQFEGDSIDIGFKSTFLIEMLNNLDSKEIVMELTEPSRAVILYPTEYDDENEVILMLLMPMMVS